LRFVLREACDSQNQGDGDALKHKTLPKGIDVPGHYRWKEVYAVTDERILGR
jgi:hypothetical protein